MKTILVSGASGIVGYGILRSLRQSGHSLRLIGSSIYDDSVAPEFCDIFELAPPTSAPNYMPWLLDIIMTHGIDCIIPGIELDLYTWVDNLAKIEASGTVPLLNNIALINQCKDKWMFYQNLNKSNIGCVIETSLSKSFEELSSLYGLPFLLKPRRGFGSKGIVKVNNLKDFLPYQKDIGSILMAQPIVGNDNEEYTIAAFCDGNGGFYASMALKRKLSKDGFTDKAEVVVMDEFYETLLELCNLFHPLGPTNFQFRKCKNQLKLLEINPRISSSTSIRTAFGYNESAMAVDYYLSNKLPAQPKIKYGKASRYIGDIIFYEDSIHI